MVVRYISTTLKPKSISYTSRGGRLRRAIGKNQPLENRNRGRAKYISYGKKPHKSGNKKIGIKLREVEINDRPNTPT